MPSFSVLKLSPYRAVAFTVSLSQTSTWTENGSTEAYQASVSCTFAAFDVPESVVIRQVDAGGTALREDAYAP